MKPEMLGAIRLVIENAYVRASWGSAAVPDSQRQAALERFKEQIETDVEVLRGMVEHEADVRQTKMAPDEAVLVFGDEQ